jgi:hypothetical protein
LGGLGWIGPRPAPTETGFSETMAILHQGFVSTNTLADVVDRHSSGAIGDEPRYGWALRRRLKNGTKPTAEEQQLIEEADALFTEWYDSRQVHTLLLEAARTLLLARRSALRLYVPRGKLQATNITDDTGRARTVKVVPVAEGDIAAGLSMLWPDHPSPESATVAEDPDSKESIGITVYRQGRNVQGTTAGTEVAELTYLTGSTDANGNQLTLIRQTNSAAMRAPRATNAPAPLPLGVTLRLGGRLPIHEMKRPAFITAQMIQQQRALNLALSALPRNIVTAGWLERVIANAQMPGKWVNDPEAATGKRWVPDKHTTGAGVTTYLKGLRQEDATSGGVSYATPSVAWRPPVPVDPTVNATEALYRAMLREAHQEHVILAQATAASDKSREQARADFEMTLRPTAAAINACGRWLLETALAMAEEFANVPGKYTNALRATFECQLNTGPITSDERTAIDGSVKAGTLSVETAMQLQNIPDPVAEMARIQAQPGAQLGITERQLTAIGTAATAGLDIAGAGELVGLTAVEAESLVPEFDPATDPAGGGDPTGGGGTGDGGGDPAPQPPTPQPAPRSQNGGGGGKRPVPSSGGGKGGQGA